MPPFITFFCRGHRVRDIAKPGKGARWRSKLQRCTLMIQEHVMCLSALLVKSLDAHFASPRVVQERSRCRWAALVESWVDDASSKGQGRTAGSIIPGWPKEDKSRHLGGWVQR